MKRSPLKPGKPTRRNTPLRRTGWLSGRAREAAMTRGSGLRRRSAPKDTGPSRTTRRLVLERDGYACVCCGQSVIGRRYSLQHLLTVLGTGTTGCHLRIDSRAHPRDEAKGYTVRSGQDPHSVSVMVFSEDGSRVTRFPACNGQWSDQPGRGDA